MPWKRAKPKPCIACGGTRRNSKGGLCHPCSQNYAAETSKIDQPVPVKTDPVVLPPSKPKRAF